MLDKVAKAVESIIINTKKGNIKWSITDSNSYYCTINDNTIVMQKVSSNLPDIASGETDILISILNNNSPGNVLEVRDHDLTDYIASPYMVLKEVFDIARFQASNFDVLADSIVSGLPEVLSFESLIEMKKKSEETPF